MIVSGNNDHASITVRIISTSHSLHWGMELLGILGFKEVRSRWSILPFPATSAVNVAQCPCVLVARIGRRLKAKASIHFQAGMASQVPHVPELVRITFKNSHDDLSIEG